MNDLEFRRQAYADPSCRDEAFLQAARQSPERQEFIDDLQAFDQQLEQALNVPVPDNLGDEILLAQSFDEHRRSKRRMRFHLALAASVAFIAGLSLTLLRGLPPQQSSLGELALAHQHGEAALMATIDEQLSLSQVNAKLAALGGQLSGEIGHVYSTNFCQLDNVRGVHLVVGGQHGKVSIMLLPPQNQRPVSSHFADERYQGMIQRDAKGDVVIIGEHGEPLEQWQQKLTRQLNWGSI